MKIIALGDIHGNLPALEVALRESRAEGYDVLCHTGDVVGFAPFPEETVALLRTENVPGVRGNLDESVATEAEDAGCSTPWVNLCVALSGRIDRGGSVSQGVALGWFVTAPSGQTPVFNRNISKPRAGGGGLRAQAGGLQHAGA